MLLKPLGKLLEAVIPEPQPTRQRGLGRVPPGRMLVHRSKAEPGCGGAGRALLLLLLLLMLPAHAALANRKTDVITLYNGDRLTGEIESLSLGKLAFNTNAMGVVNVEWKEVASIASNYNYEVRLTDGQRFFGTVQPGSVPGTVLLTDVFGERNLGWQEMVEMRPVQEDLVDRIELYMSANYAFTKASGVRQTEFIADVAFNQRDAVNKLTSRVTVSDTETDSTTSSRFSAQRQIWTDRESMFRLLFGGFESNDELGLDSRYTLGAGLGRYFIDTNNKTLSGAIGLQGLTENGFEGSRQESVEAVIAGSFAAWRFDTPELDLNVTTSLYPSLTESGRFRADTTARVRWEIITDLYWNVNAWGSYDSASVEEEGGEFDWGITTGLGWSF